ncbi:hypothetical protein [Brevibacillus aydinogluensis]|jgi:ferritin|uniref:Uncharacterized protein n=1 Tax=Brevibacillus aydinogluensis TaxID=927786 RepID=A0AA48M6Q0_9BACL|nr:hypothetical protein [Brevibacillus aydinogluensis]CAJ1002248.1 hypothetical protein BSPP4475_07975 [Brevibacillus aydinogluensis]
MDKNKAKELLELFKKIEDAPPEVIDKIKELLNEYKEKKDESL